MRSTNRPEDAKTDGATTESEGTVDALVRERIQAAVAENIPKLEQVHDRLPIDVSLFTVQLVPEGFDIAVHYSMSGRCFFFASGMSAAQRSVVRQLITHFDPKSTLASMNVAAGLLFCGRWSPLAPEQIFAWRYYFVLEEGRTFVPIGLHRLPRPPAETAELCGTHDVCEIYGHSATASAATLCELIWGNKPPVTVRSILFSPAEHDSDLPTFLVDIKKLTKARRRIEPAVALIA